MSNNRMYIRRINKPEVKILLAKYDPDSGWTIFHDTEDYDKWFQSNRISWDLFGDTNLELVYETEIEDLGKEEQDA